jgi:ABC-type molybdate transport system ATPase subunit
MVHVTHSVAEARMLGDQLVRLEKGRVVERGAAGDVLANAAESEE